MGDTAVESVYGAFATDEIVKLKRQDKKKVFSEEIDRLQKNQQRVLNHKKHYDTSQSTAEIKNYQEVYEEFAHHFKAASDYIAHFDYFSADSKEKKTVKRSVRSHLDKMDELVAQLKALDEAYNLIDENTFGETEDISFWDEEQPDANPRLNLFGGIKKKALIIGLAALICLSSAIAVGSAVSKNVSSANNSVDYTKSKPLSEWYYELHENVEATPENTVIIGEDRFPLILGKSTMQDLLDAGYEYDYSEYESHFESDGEEYVVIHHNFYYSYKSDDSYENKKYGIKNPNVDRIPYSEIVKQQNINAYGYGSAILYNEKGSKVKVAFGSFQDCEAQKLDLSKCYVTTIEIYFTENTKGDFPFEYYGFDSDLTIEGLREQFTEANVLDYYLIDDDKDGFKETERLLLHVSRFVELDTYHHIKESEYDRDSISIQIDSRYRVLQ